MTAAFDQTETITRGELLNRAIHGIRNAKRRERLRKRFEEDSSRVYDLVSARLVDYDTDDAEELSSFLTVGGTVTIDPNKIERWIAILRIVLTIVALFL